MSQQQPFPQTVTATYDPAALLTTSPITPPPPRALIVLNQPVSSRGLLEKVWAATSYRVFADGGANRIYDLLNSTTATTPPDTTNPASSFLPNLIHGDLDSLRPSVRSFYASHSVDISLDPDQYSTDFGKALKKIRLHSATLPDPGITDVLICSGLGGRLDHAVSLLSELGREATRHPELRLYLVTDTSVAFLLRPGERSVIGPLRTGAFTENVGVLPVWGRALIWTKGLEWDVEGWETEMGGMVSSSNHIKADVVEVGVEEKGVLFTVERTGV